MKTFFDKAVKLDMAGIVEHKKNKKYKKTLDNCAVICYNKIKKWKGGEKLGFLTIVLTIATIFNLLVGTAKDIQEMYLKHNEHHS